MKSDSEDQSTRENLINTLLQPLSVPEFISICNLWISEHFEILLRPYNMFVGIAIQIYKKVILQEEIIT